MPRTKRLSQQDYMMRRDGYATATEVAEACGLTLSTVHRGVQEKRIPGKVVTLSEPTATKPRGYRRTYVALRDFIRGGHYAESHTAQTNLQKLSDAVAEARRDRAAVLPREPPTPVGDA